MSITHDKTHIKSHQMSRNQGLNYPHPPYYIKIRNVIVLFTFLLQHISINLIVLWFNDRTTYHMVLQLYTLLTFECINIQCSTIFRP